MSNSASSTRLPPNFGTRLQALFCLGSTPKTLGDFEDLLREHMKERMEEPRLREEFRSIIEGRAIFGHVDYETHHSVRTPDGREVHVACALDALVEGFFQPIDINSICPHCRQPIHLEVSQGDIKLSEPSSAVIWLGASREVGASCAADLCPYINFFSSVEHAAEWMEKNPNELGMILSIQQSLELARKCYWEPTRFLKVKVNNLHLRT